ncbi:ferredoxin--NADP(+) reductase [Tatumella sp. TA1]|uniref:ferredoxin--NADP(+) reductase n=1 Tax=Rosenbergiella collisarenosi TaxID=1544695 RepID=UPI0008F7F70E|nr:ferredoxin--NADP(+) reductase [Rosenbergiella collisarenosi]MBT0721713.1 ferredoxin--NADP(+) reductase [Rosenbergiella collisarenosi]QGX92851.1 ferredoxin--NADP(+) reductase [Tatumella sp. TA1]
MAVWCTGKIIEVKPWTDTLFSLIVDAPIAPFTAGQFAKLSLTLEGETLQRAYSYVNAPSQTPLEFYLVHVPEGRLSPALLALKPGDEVLVTQEAAGYFVLEEVPDAKELWMIATGTAIGPYLSILQQGEDLERFDTIILVHAARHAADLSYMPLFEQLQLRYGDKLRIQTVVSRENATGSLRGRVPALLDDGSLEKAVNTQICAENSHIMICGNPEMVRETQKYLKEQRGLRKHLRRKPGHITSEHYW